MCPAVPISLQSLLGRVGAGGVLGAWAMGTVDSVRSFTCSSDHSTAVEEACSVPGAVPGAGDLVVNKVESPSSRCLPSKGGQTTEQVQYAAVREKQQERGSECLETGILVGHRMLPEDCLRNSPCLLRTCRMPRATPDGPAAVSGRGRLSSEPHANFQFRNINITLGVGPVP